MTIGQRFARLTTNVVVRVPGAWRLFRRPMQRMFDRVAPQWDGRRTTPERLASLRAALSAIPAPVARALDVGTGTGAGARVAASVWPEAEIVGVDLSTEMIAEARRLASTDRERYDVADSSKLPFDDASFDVVFLNNMIPFFDELARVVAPGGHLAVAYGLGEHTPIFVPSERLLAELGRRGFSHVADFAEGGGTALLARKADPS
jgi:ubiquinone/menaquinone biosynthesis C-methylase UbiE